MPVIDPTLSCNAAETPNQCRVQWFENMAVGVTFLEIIDSDVVNSTILTMYHFISP